MNSNANPPQDEPISPVCLEIWKANLIYLAWQEDISLFSVILDGFTKEELASFVNYIIANYRDYD